VDVVTGALSITQILVIVVATVTALPKRILFLTNLNVLCCLNTIATRRIPAILAS